MAKKAKKSKKQTFVRISAFLLAGMVDVPVPAPAHAQTLSCPQSLTFGEFTTCGVSNSATVTPNNGRTTTGCLSATGAPFSRALCVVTQTFPLRPIQFSVTKTTFKINHTSVADTMTVDNFKCLTGSVSCTTANAIVSTTFFLSVPIGARLNVNNPQTAGTYTGTFTVNAVLQ